MAGGYNPHGEGTSEYHTLEARRLARESDTHQDAGHYAKAQELRDSADTHFEKAAAASAQRETGGMSTAPGERYSVAQEKWDNRGEPLREGPAAPPSSEPRSVLRDVNAHPPGSEGYHRLEMQRAGERAAEHARAGRFEDARIAGERSIEHERLMNEAAARNAGGGWNEGDHPRDENGKFAPK